MATIADFLGQGALAPYADDIVAVGHTPESFFGLVADDAVDTINQKVLPDSAKNAFWLRKLLFEASPKLLLEHGDKFETTFVTENALRMLTWEELKAQVTEAGVTQYIQILALYVKLGHALPYNPQEQITMQAMAELKQEGIHFHVTQEMFATVKRPAEQMASPVAAVEQKSAKKQKKDKNAPKRARSAYLVFLDRNRQAIMQHNPAMPMCEVTKILANRWAMVTPEEKAICEEEAAKDKIRYDTEFRIYSAKLAAAEGGGEVQEGGADGLGDGEGGVAGTPGGEHLGVGGGEEHHLGVQQDGQEAMQTDGGDVAGMQQYAEGAGESSGLA